MNALANDQARRLADLIRGHDALKGVRAAIYTGETAGRSRTRVTADGLINDRNTHPVRAARHPAHQLQDARPAAAAQRRPAAARGRGDEPAVPRARRVPHLRRRPGHRRRDAAAATRSRRSDASARPDHRRRPAPARSATSRRSRPARPSATTATRRACSRSPRPCSASRSPPTASCARPDNPCGSGCRAALARGHTPRRRSPAPLDNALVADDRRICPHDIDDAVAPRPRRIRPGGRCSPTATSVDWANVSDDDLLASVASHRSRAGDRARAPSRPSASTSSPTGCSPPASASPRPTRAAERAAAPLPHPRVRRAQPRARATRARALSIDLHLWIRELTRIDRAATSTVRFHWADDGPVARGRRLDAETRPGSPRSTAVTAAAAAGASSSPRSATNSPRPTTTSAAITPHATPRAASARSSTLRPRPKLRSAATRSHGLAWFDHEHRALLDVRPPMPTTARAPPLPVLALTGDDVDDDSRDDMCPACGRRDGIRFLGSAMATMLSVVVTTCSATPTSTAPRRRRSSSPTACRMPRTAPGSCRAARTCSRCATPSATPSPTTRRRSTRSSNLLVQDAGDDRRRPLPTAAARPRRPRRVPRVLEGADAPQRAGGRTDARQSAAAVRPRDGVRPAVARRPHARTDRQPRCVRVESHRGLDARRGPQGARRDTGRRTARRPRPGIELGRGRRAVGARRARAHARPRRHRPRVVHALHRRRRQALADLGRPSARRRACRRSRPAATRPAIPRVGPHAPTGDDATAHPPRRRVVSAELVRDLGARRCSGSTPADGVRLTSALLAELERTVLLRSHPVAGGARPRTCCPPSSVVVEPGRRATALKRGSTSPRMRRVPQPRDRHRPTRSLSCDGGPCVSARCPGPPAPVRRRAPRTTTARSTTRVDATRRRPGAHEPARYRRSASSTRTGSRRRPTTRRRRTCSSRRRRSRWASTSATCRPSCSRVCPAASRRICSASAAPAA